MKSLRSIIYLYILVHVYTCMVVELGTGRGDSCDSQDCTSTERIDWLLVSICEFWWQSASVWSSWRESVLEECVSCDGVMESTIMCSVNRDLEDVCGDVTSREIMTK